MRNEFSVKDGHVEIYLQRKTGERLVALVDIADFAKVASIPGSWYAQWSKNTKSFYACPSCFTKNGKQSRVRGFTMMHRMIMDAGPCVEVDHVDPSRTLDNRRANLRIATRRQNALNSRRGASRKCHFGWTSSVSFRGHCYSLGVYPTQVEADLIRAGAVILADAIEAREHGTQRLPESFVDRFRVDEAKQ